MNLAASLQQNFSHLVLTHAASSMSTSRRSRSNADAKVQHTLQEQPGKNESKLVVKAARTPLPYTANYDVDGLKYSVTTRTTGTTCAAAQDRPTGCASL